MLGKYAPHAGTATPGRHGLSSAARLQNDERGIPGIACGYSIFARSAGADA